MSASKEEKPLEDLVREEIFIVERVLGIHKSTSVIEGSVSIGGLNYDTSTGNVSTLSLAVLPYSVDHASIPIRKLVFHGNSPVTGGNLIRAKIPRLERRRSYLVSENEENRNYNYCDRPYGIEERAIEISILKSEGSLPIRTDRATNYSDYLKD